MMMRTFDVPLPHRSVTNTRAPPSDSHSHSHSYNHDHDHDHNHDHDHDHGHGISHVNGHDQSHSHNQRHSPSPSPSHGPFAISFYFPARVSMTMPASAARRCMDQPQPQLMRTSRSWEKQGVAIRSARREERAARSLNMPTGLEGGAHEPASHPVRQTWLILTVQGRPLEWEEMGGEDSTKDPHPVRRRKCPPGLHLTRHLGPGCTGYLRLGGE